MSQYKDIIYEEENGFAIITLNRPDRLNAIGWAMRLELPKAFENVRRNDNVQALIVTGAGRAFCSGGDVKGQHERAMGKVPEEVAITELWEPIGSFASELHKLEKLTIAAVNGVAMGAGMSIASLCDLRIASEKAKFGAVFNRVGLVPDCGLSYTLPRLVGVSKSIELMLLNEIIDAREAERIGFVNKVVPAEDLMKAAKEIASKIAAGAPIATRLTKQAVYFSLFNTLREQLHIESDMQRRCLNSQDQREAAQAFVEKRKPVFKGR